MKKTDPVSLQIQTVLYKNDPDALMQALDNIANAIRVDRESDHCLSWVRVCYGDASPVALFTADEAARIADRYKNWFEFSYEFFGRNSGTAAGHNHLAESCEAEYVQVMNPDVIVTPHIYRRLLAPFSVPELRCGMTEARQTPIEHHKEYDRKTGVTSWAATAMVIFPYKVFQQVGGFDADTFFMYCDDVDFSWMIRLAGYQIIYVPSALVFHSKHLSPTGQWQPTAAEVYYSAEASLFMYHKWSNPQLLEQVLNHFLTLPADQPERKAAEVFVQRRNAGTLPTPRDPQHTVAEFVGFNYGKSRFTVV